jgi:hypothetical protein
MQKWIFFPAFTILVYSNILWNVTASWYGFLLHFLVLTAVIYDFDRRCGEYARHPHTNRRNSRDPLSEEMPKQ